MTHRQYKRFARQSLEEVYTELRQLTRKQGETVPGVEVIAVKAGLALDAIQHDSDEARRRLVELRGMLHTLYKQLGG